MLHGKHVEDDSPLSEMGAILRTDPDDDGCWLVQMDNHYIRDNGNWRRNLKAFGWHKMPKSKFIDLRGKE